MRGGTSERTIKIRLDQPSMVSDSKLREILRLQIDLCVRPIQPYTSCSRTAVIVACVRERERERVWERKKELSEHAQTTVADITDIPSRGCAISKHSTQNPAIKAAQRKQNLRSLAENGGLYIPIFSPPHRRAPTPCLFVSYIPDAPRQPS